MISLLYQYQVSAKHSEKCSGSRSSLDYSWENKLKWLLTFL